MNKKLILITGGARSGKSEFAERLVHKMGTKCAYVATAEIRDEEMRLRVEQHRRRRDSDFWLSVEAPFAAHNIISDIVGVDSILFDCVTIYLSNLLYGSSAQTEEPGNYEKSLLAIDNLLAAARASGKHVVFVTNELGSGIVPDNAMSREFRDLAGLVNQKIAQTADEVYMVVCGIAVDLKKVAIQLDDNSVKS